MIPVPVIKYLIMGAGIVSVFFYVKNLQEDVAELESKYSEEVKLRQDTANILLAERLDSVKVQELADNLEKSFNELNTENAKYRECVAKRNCYISLRKQSTTPAEKTAGTSSIDNEVHQQFNGDVQRDILDLRTSIKRDGEVIKSLQKYITTFCTN